MIQDKYLLVIMIPYYIDEENRRSTDALWNKDIIKHLVQISNLTLAAPARYEAPPDKVVPIDPAMFRRDTLLPGPAPLQHHDLRPALDPDGHSQAVAIHLNDGYCSCERLLMVDLLRLDRRPDRQAAVQK